MDPKARALLYDIEQAGILLERFVSGRTFDDYVADPLLRSGIERQLEIIGEALNQLSKIDTARVARVEGPPSYRGAAQHPGSRLCQSR